MSTPEFSIKTRAQNLKRAQEKEFDFLVIGGGITGTGVAWDAASRGYKVLLVEKDDFAQGTSSRSSKLVHGGLRYLENYEFPLVFEALSERSFLMETCPHLVRPLPFFMPVYENSPHSSYLLSAGMWFYDVLAMFRAPALHQRISAGTSTRMIPGIKKDGLICTFKYYDASMWDDALVVDVARRAHELGACLLTRVKAGLPAVNSKEPSEGIRSLELTDTLNNRTFQARFKKLIVCAGVWTDEVGANLATFSGKEPWKKWIAPSRGLHLVFDWKRFPVPGAVTMQIEDGRIAFAIPRHDFGQGITIVGTTDGPCTLPPDQIENEKDAIQKDRAYLIQLLEKYFPHLHLKESDVLNHYIGIRPLVDPNRGKSDSAGASLQKVSREHTIDHGPGRSVIVAGGKYTTFRKMAEEIVNFAIESESWDFVDPQTEEPLFRPALPAEVLKARELAKNKGWPIPEKLYERYGADALEIYRIHLEYCQRDASDPEGFPCLEAQFRYAVRHQMVLTVEDFVRRRQPLALCRQDHGAPWVTLLQKALVEELAR